MTGSRRGLGLYLLLLFCVPLAHAIALLQNSESTDTSEKRESLVISPGDLLHVRVVEAPELDQTGRVDDRGRFPLAVGGPVFLGGMTPAEASAAIIHALVSGHYMLNPHVTVNVESYAAETVTIMGQVAKPGNYFIPTPRTLLDVLALAGGLLDTADRHITIEHISLGQTVSIFLSNKASDILKSNVAISPGDRVIVPRVPIVYFVGDVGRPGGYPASPNSSRITLLEGIALAGGTPPNAVPSRTTVIHRNADGSYIMLAVRLDKIEKGKLTDIALQPDDIVYVPYSYIRNIAVNIDALLAAAASAAIYVH